MKLMSLSQQATRTYVPFLAMGVVGFALAFSPGPRVRLTEWWVAAGLAAAASVGWFWELRKERRPGLMSSLLFLAAVGLLRDAVGGASGGVEILVALPVLWIALRGTRRQLIMVTGAAAATLVIPQIAVGAPLYPAAGWRSAILIISVGATASFVVQTLLGELRASVMLAKERAAERDRLLEHLTNLAETDTLTGIGNRRIFERRVTTAIAEAGSVSRPFCVAILDLDDFKEINDRDGHLAGDAVLRACAQAWSDALRPSDTLVRLGGDEFAILMPKCALAPAQSKLEELATITPGDVSVSVGVACWYPGEDYESLMQRADAALYTKKASRTQPVGSARWLAAPRGSGVYAPGVPPASSLSATEGPPQDRGSFTASPDEEISESYPAVARSVPRARRSVTEFAIRHGITGEPLDAIRLAVSEAVTNAVLHAYPGQLGGVIRLLAVVTSGKELWVLVADDGCGYQTPATQPGLGLGLTLIAQSSEEYIITQLAAGGTEVRMRFPIRPQSPPSVG